MPIVDVGGRWRSLNEERNALRAENERLRQEHADLKRCHDEHYQDVRTLMEQVGELRSLLKAVAFDRHCKLLHNADYEVCEDWLCKQAYALEGDE